MNRIRHVYRVVKHVQSSLVFALSSSFVLNVFNKVLSVLTGAYKYLQIEFAK